MDRAATPDIKRAGIILGAVAAALGCGGGSLRDDGGKGGAGGGTPTVCCPFGGESFASVVRARGFTAFEGRPVKAAFLPTTSNAIGLRITAETSVRGGAFDLDFPPDTPACSDSLSGDAAGAIYIDTDGDGVCSPGVDYIYTWMAFGAAGSTCATIDLTPQSPNCAGRFSFLLIEAARVVCPAVGDCLSCGSAGDGGAVVSCLV